MTTSTPAASSRASLGPTALIGLAFLVFAIIFVSTTDWYTAFMTVHVVFVVVWVGGGAILTVLGIRAERANDNGELVAIARQAAFLGHKVFAPAAIVVVAMGIAMVSNKDIGFNHFWIVFGLLGFLITFVLGIAVLAPMSKKLAALLEANGPDHPECQAAVAKLLLIARADIAMLLLVVVDMITKPFS
jgi:uncharacterized membrane protein